MRSTDKRILVLVLVETGLGDRQTKIQSPSQLMTTILFFKHVIKYNPEK